MPRLNKTSCAKLKAAAIETANHRSHSVIATFSAKSNREYRQPEVKTVRLSPVEMDKYIADQAQHWGRSVAPVSETV